MKVIGKDLSQNFKSTFLSCEKDQELIWRRLFVDSGVYSEILKRLLVVNTSDCLDFEKYQYKQIVQNLTLKDLMDKGYLRVTPRLEMGEHEEVKTYIILSFDDIVPSSNPEYRRINFSFGILCHHSCWEMDDYKIRPFQIAGYIDGLLAGTHLSGIGTLENGYASTFQVDEELSGLILTYTAIHGKDDDSRLNPDLPAPQYL